MPSYPQTDVNDWRRAVRDARVMFQQDWHPDLWPQPWSHALRTRTVLNQLPEPGTTLPPDMQAAQQRYLREHAKLVAGYSKTHPVTADSVRGTVPAVIIRRFLGLPSDQQHAPLNDLRLDRRPDRWAVLDEQELVAGNPGIGCWVAVTFAAAASEPRRWGDRKVVRVSALVADLLSRHHNELQAQTTPVRARDTDQVMTVALRLWSENRPQHTPLSQWPKAVAAARTIVT